MAGQDVKIRAKLAGDVVTVKSLMRHPMETGNRKDSKTGELVPEHYITEVNCTYNGEHVMTANWGPSVSKNPYLSFDVKGGKAGDTVAINWVDNKGGSGSGETSVR